MLGKSVSVTKDPIEAKTIPTREQPEPNSTTTFPSNRSRTPLFFSTYRKNAVP